MKYDPITGPIPRAEFQALVSAPHGEAIKVIRKYDPLWGCETGEKIKWRVTYQRRATETGRAMVEAVTLKEAQKLADESERQPDRLGARLPQRRLWRCRQDRAGR